MKDVQGTAAEDRIPIFQKFIYSIGSLANDSQAAFIGPMIIILNLGLGVNPLAVGIIGFFPRLLDAILDPIIGYSSDNARTRFGRRRPFILFGAITSGICYALMFHLYRGHSEMFYIWWVLIFQTLFFVGFTCYSIPWIALGYELTPDYHERTRLQSWSKVFAQVPWLIAPWCWKIMYNKNFFPDPNTGGADVVLGARVLAVMVGSTVILGGILPAIFNKEHFAHLPKPEKKNKLEIVKDLFVKIGITFKNKLFVKLCATTFLIFNGFMLASAFTAYIIFFYVYKNIGSLDMAYNKGGTLLGFYGMFSAICTVGVVSFIPWLSRKLGKREAFFVTIPISIIGYALLWVGYSQAQPYLLLICAPLVTWGLGSLFVLNLSMVADACDIDELETGERREGMFSAVFWLMLKIGLGFAGFLGGLGLNLTGFKQSLGLAQSDQTLLWMRILNIGIPILTSIIALFIIKTIDITEEKAHEIRRQLEARRGKA